MLTTRSRLCLQILDSLHGNGIEIVSPAFMNQRHMESQTKVVPASVEESPTIAPPRAEQIAFDKAEQAEQREKAKQELRDEIKGLESSLKTAADDEKQRIADLLGSKRNMIEEIEKPAKKAT